MTATNGLGERLAYLNYSEGRRLVRMSELGNEGSRTIRATERSPIGEHWLGVKPFSGARGGLDPIPHDIKDECGDLDGCHPSNSFTSEQRASSRWRSRPMPSHIGRSRALWLYLDRCDRKHLPLSIDQKIIVLTTKVGDGTHDETW